VDPIEIPPELPGRRDVVGQIARDHLLEDAQALDGDDDDSARLRHAMEVLEPGAMERLGRWLNTENAKTASNVPSANALGGLLRQGLEGREVEVLAAPRDRDVVHVGAGEGARRGVAREVRRMRPQPQPKSSTRAPRSNSNPPSRQRQVHAPPVPDPAVDEALLRRLLSDDAVDQVRGRQGNCSGRSSGYSFRECQENQNQKSQVRGSGIRIRTSGRSAYRRSASSSRRIEPRECAAGEPPPLGKLGLRHVGDPC
jgi:hypothetical protein